MTDAEYHRYQKRLSRGWSAEQAYHLPVNKPRWMADIEREEGLPVIDIVKREIRHGLSLTQISRSFEVSKDVLCYWVRKWKAEGLL